MCSLVVSQGVNVGTFDTQRAALGERMNARTRMTKAGAEDAAYEMPSCNSCGRRRERWQNGGQNGDSFNERQFGARAGFVCGCQKGERRANLCCVRQKGETKGMQESSLKRSNAKD